MKKETYLKIKKNKTKAILLAILTSLSLIGCKNNNADVEEESIYNLEESHVQIVYVNGNIFPSKLDNFTINNNNAFARMSISIYDSYKRDKEIIGCIPEYQTMEILYSNEEFSYIKTTNGRSAKENLDTIYGYVHNDLITILPDNYIETDISDQTVKVVDNNETVLYTTMTSGKPGHNTDIGYTEILSKTYNRYLVGPGYKKYVKYFFHFNNDEEGFHDASWRSEFGVDIYLTNGSLGCVNMREEDVEIMDKHIKVGTKVLTHE